MGSDEESGKDWSDLEREAAEEDRNNDYATDDKRNGKFESKKHNKSSKHRYAECDPFQISIRCLLILLSVINTIQQSSLLYLFNYSSASRTHTVVASVRSSDRRTVKSISRIPPLLHI